MASDRTDWNPVPPVPDAEPIDAGAAIGGIEMLAGDTLVGIIGAMGYLRGYLNMSSEWLIISFTADMAATLA